MKDPLHFFLPVPLEIISKKINKKEFHVYNAFFYSLIKWQDQNDETELAKQECHTPFHIACVKIV